MFPVVKRVLLARLLSVECGRVPCNVRVAGLRRVTAAHAASWRGHLQGHRDEFHF